MIQFILESDRELFEGAFRYAHQQVRKLIESHPEFYPIYTKGRPGPTGVTASCRG